MACPLRFRLILGSFALVTLSWTSFGVAQTGPQKAAPDAGVASPVPQPPSGQPMPGSIRGTVVDESGATVVGALVRLTQVPTEEPIFSSHNIKKDTLSDSEGQFSFTEISPGPFQLTITSSGFAPKTIPGTLHSGEDQTIPQIEVEVAEARTEVDVSLTRDEIAEIAEEQIKVEEKQRVLAVIPNFYVSYIPNAAPLNAQQKFKLAWRTIIDPFTFVVVAGTAGVEQAQNHFAEYGQGTEGYAKRFGAGYADAVSGTFIGGAILPSLLRQDPRYFYKGTGSKTSRFLYAIANSVICKGDNGKWQPNYSNVLGSLAAGGISNLYYPRQDRDGAGLTFENAAIGIGATAIQNLFQEFLIRKLTPKRDLKNP